MKRFIVALAVCSISFAGIGAGASPKKETSAPAAKTPTPAAAVLEDSSLSGKVVETMNAGGYTYVSLEKNGKKTWAAIPATEVKVGQELKLQPGVEMKMFTSKTLNRTFESIIFSGGPLSKPSHSGENKPAAPHGAGAAAPAKPHENIKVEKAAGPDAYTVAEVHEKIASLNEKTAVVKAQVIKVSSGILGKNWIHLQDGSGDASLGTNKLVTTSGDLPTVGDIVTMKGTMYLDKDFGAGYKYHVIMEKASIQR